MTTYRFFGAGYALPYDAPHVAPLRVRLDVPDLIENAKLALADDPNNAVKLPSTGFASGDVLDVFLVPAGTIVRRLNIRIITPEGAAATADAGVIGDDPDGFLMDANLNASAGTIYFTGDAIGYGTENSLGYYFESDGAVSITFGADVDTLVADVWAEAQYVAAQ